MEILDGMQIADVTREQFPVWRRMRQELYPNLDPEMHDEEMEWLFEAKDSAAYLAFSDDGEPIGLLEVSLRNVVDGCIGGPVGYVEGIYLEPSYRRKGLGAKLMEFATEWCRKRGCQDMATDAEIENVEAQEFYRQTGFTEVSRTVGFTRSLRSGRR
jgi:aminoglycoside 6'-N-acetyltransferase I